MQRFRSSPFRQLFIPGRLLLCIFLVFLILSYSYWRGSTGSGQPCGYAVHRLPTFTLSKSFTITAWGRLVGKSSYNTIFALENSDQDVSILWLGVKDSPSITLSAHLGSSPLDGPNKDGKSSWEGNDPNWMHVAFVWDFEKREQLLYANGTVVDHLNLGDDALKFTSATDISLTIGRNKWNSTWGNSWDGQVDIISYFSLHST